MRTINLPLQLETDLKDRDGKDVPVNVPKALRNALYSDEQLSRGLENLVKGKRVLDALERFGESCILKLEEDEYKTLVSAIDKMTWGAAGYFMIDIIKKIKEAPEDPRTEEKKKPK